MIEIKDLLARFKNTLFSEEVKRNLIMEVLKEETGLQINFENIKIKDNIVYLNIKPIYKNEILFKKEKIFEKLRERLGKKAPNNII